MVVKKEELKNRQHQKRVVRLPHRQNQNQKLSNYVNVLAGPLTGLTDQGELSNVLSGPL